MKPKPQKKTLVGKTTLSKKNNTGLSFQTFQAIIQNDSNKNMILT